MSIPVTTSDPRFCPECIATAIRLITRSTHADLAVERENHPAEAHDCSQHAEAA